MPLKHDVFPGVTTNVLPKNIALETFSGGNLHYQLSW